MLNSDFNQSIADDFNDGDESEDNVKRVWEDELKVAQSVVAHKISHNQTYTLAGFYGDDKPFEFKIPNVSLIECETNSGENIKFAVSKKLIKSIDKNINEEKNEGHITVYLKDSTPLENPVSGVYIDKADFPKELLQ
mgnify:CR=1 FL=1